MSLLTFFHIWYKVVIETIYKIALNYIFHTHNYNHNRRQRIRPASTQATFSCHAAKLIGSVCGISDI